MQVAYEHVRIALQEKLARSLLENTLEDALIKTHESLVECNSSEPNDNATVNVDTGPQSTDTTISVLTFMWVCRGQSIHKNLGAVNKTDRPSSGTELIRVRSAELEKLCNVTGFLQVTKCRKEMAPPCLIQKALSKEVEQNWQSAYEEVNEKDVPRTTNVIGSHIIYKTKSEEND